MWWWSFLFCRSCWNGKDRVRQSSGSPAGPLRPGLQLRRDLWLPGTTGVTGCVSELTNRCLIAGLCCVLSCRRWAVSLWVCVRWAPGAASTSSTVWRSACCPPCLSRSSTSRWRWENTATPTETAVRAWYRSELGLSKKTVPLYIRWP